MFPFITSIASQLFVCLPIIVI